MAALLLHGCASTPPDKAFDSPLGTWQTKIQTVNGLWLPHGVLTITDDKRATYTFHNGRVLFTSVDDQSRWTGNWVEDQWGDINCGTEIDGSVTWGVAVFQFDETYNKIKGSWDKCGDGRTNDWVGSRI